MYYILISLNGCYKYFKILYEHQQILDPYDIFQYFNKYWCEYHICMRTSRGLGGLSFGVVFCRIPHRM